VQDGLDVALKYGRGVQEECVGEGRSVRAAGTLSYTASSQIQHDVQY
jgi:hypothetical protein